MEENNCPICKDTMMVPRIYECGHSICEPCMIKCDKSDQKKNLSIYSVPEYSCPLCRHKTIVEWYERPINRILLSILRNDENYNKKYEKYMKDHKELEEVDEIPEKINLSFLVNENKKRITLELYKKIVPILFDAASDGKSYISFSSTISKKIQIVSDILSEKLFKNYNIYKMVSTSRECIIEIIPTDLSYKNEFINDNYNHDTDEMLINNNEEELPGRSTLQSPYVHNTNETSIDLEPLRINNYRLPNMQ